MTCTFKPDINFCMSESGLENQTVTKWITKKAKPCLKFEQLVLGWTDIDHNFSNELQTRGSRVHWKSGLKLRAKQETGGSNWEKLWRSTQNGKEGIYGSDAWIRNKKIWSLKKQKSLSFSINKVPYKQFQFGTLNTSFFKKNYSLSINHNWLGLIQVI